MSKFVGLVAGLVVVLASAVAVAQAYPVQSGPLSVSSTTVGPGGTVQISGGGFAPGATVQLLLFSAPVSLGSISANGAGAISAAVTIPASTPAGQHTLEATGAAGSGGTLTLSASITVSGSSSGSGGRGLAITGTEVGLTVGVGVVLVVLGSVAAVGFRRRRRQVI